MYISVSGGLSFRGTFFFSQTGAVLLSLVLFYRYVSVFPCLLFCLYCWYQSSLNSLDFVSVLFIMLWGFFYPIYLGCWYILSCKFCHCYRSVGWGLGMGSDGTMMTWRWEEMLVLGEDGVNMIRRSLRYFLPLTNPIILVSCTGFKSHACWNDVILLFLSSYFFLFWCRHCRVVPIYRIVFIEPVVTIEIGAGLQIECLGSSSHHFVRFGFCIFICICIRLNLRVALGYMYAFAIHGDNSLLVRFEKMYAA